MAADHLLFLPIEPTPQSWSHWGVSLGTHVFAGCLLLLVPALSVQEAIVHRPSSVSAESTKLYLPAPPLPAPPLPAPPLPAPTKVRQPDPVRIISDSRPAPVILTRQDVAFSRHEVSFRPPVAVIAAKPVIPDAPGMEPSALRLPVGETAAAVLPANRPVTPLKVGVFDAGQSGSGGHATAVAGLRTGGFDEGRGGATAGRAAGGAPVRQSGFDLPAQASAPVSRGGPGHTDTPVEVTFKPKPLYTAEARKLGVEGEVLLDVIFSAGGRVEVIRVVKGLGFGLDDSARNAAGEIRFRPGLRDGSPVDVRSIVHIVFQVS